MTPLPASIRRWLTEPSAKDVALAIERIAKTDDVRHVAVMPDVHLGKGATVGSAPGPGTNSCNIVAVPPRCVGVVLMALLLLLAGLLFDELPRRPRRSPRSCVTPARSS